MIKKSIAKYIAEAVSVHAWQKPLTLGRSSAFLNTSYNKEIAMAATSEQCFVPMKDLQRCRGLEVYAHQRTVIGERRLVNRIIRLFICNFKLKT